MPMKLKPNDLIFTDYGKDTWCFHIFVNNYKIRVISTVRLGNDFLQIQTSPVIDL